MVKELRTNWGLLKNELANKIGVSRKAITNAEKTEHLSQELIKKYSDFFGVNMNELLGKSSTYEEMNIRENDKIALKGISMGKHSLYSGFEDPGIKRNTIVYFVLLGAIITACFINVILVAFLRKALKWNISTTPTVLILLSLISLLGAATYGVYHLWNKGLKFKGTPISKNRNSMLGLDVLDRTIYFRNFNGFVKKYDFQQLQYVQKIDDKKFKTREWVSEKYFRSTFQMVEIKFEDENVAYFLNESENLYDKLSEALYINSHADRNWNKIIEERREERTQEFNSNAK